MIRVLLVEDHNLVRAGLERLLDQTDDIVVAGVAAGGKEAIEQAAALRPDVILMDVSMPDIDGVESTRLICEAHPDAKVVMLTADIDRGRVVAALDAGALGYLIKDAEPADLVHAVRSAASGEAPLDPRAARALLDLRVRAQATTPELTDRETEVLGLVAEWLANKVIARRLGISEKTVKAHLTRIYSQIGVSDRTQATIWVRDHHWTSRN